MGEVGSVVYWVKMENMWFLLQTLMWRKRGWDRESICVCTFLAASGNTLLEEGWGRDWLIEFSGNGARFFCFFFFICTVPFGIDSFVAFLGSVYFCTIFPFIGTTGTRTFLLRFSSVHPHSRPLPCSRSQVPGYFENR